MAGCLCYVTCADQPEAVRIARALVEERLAASANVMGESHSVYRWEGEVREAVEAVLIAKTSPDLAERLIERVRALHSYVCPCVVILPIVAGNPAYLAWLVAQTGETLEHNIN